MKLIWHIIKKDIGRERWALLLWVLLLAGQLGLGLFLLRADGTDGVDQEWVAQWQRGSWLLVFLQFAMGYILVIRFVQADELAGTRMFWVTRPISARRLLAAKALGILLIFGLLPVLLHVPWWLYNNFGARELAGSAIEVLGWQLLMIAPACLIATLTDDLGRALMWTLALIMGLVAWTIWVQSVLKTAIGGPSPSVRSGLLFTRLWLAGAVLVTGAVVVSIHQFLTRRFLRSMVLAVPVLGMIALIGRAWPWDCSILFTPPKQPELVPTAAAGAFADVQLDVAPARIMDWGNTAIRTQEASAYIRQNMEVRGVPDDLMIRGQASGQTWRWPQGPVLSSRTSRFYSRSDDRALRKSLALPALPDDPETLRWDQERRDRENADRVARGLPLWEPRPRSGDRVMMLGYARFPVSQITRIREQPPAYASEFEVVLSRLQIVFELPLKPGIQGSGGAQTYRITGWTHARDNNPDPTRRMNRGLARMVLTNPSLQGNGLWLVNAIDPSTRNRNPLPDDFMAVNRTDGNYEGLDLNYGVSPTRARIGGVDIHWCEFSVNPGRVIRSGQWVERDPDWFDHITWLLMADQPVARLTREVKTEKFELEPSALEKARAEAAQEKGTGKF